MGRDAACARSVLRRESVSASRTTSGRPADCAGGAGASCLALGLQLTVPVPLSGGGSELEWPLAAAGSSGRRAIERPPGRGGQGHEAWRRGHHPEARPFPSGPVSPNEEGPDSRPEGASIRSISSPTQTQPSPRAIGCSSSQEVRHPLKIRTHRHAHDRRTQRRGPRSDRHDDPILTGDQHRRVDRRLALHSEHRTNATHTTSSDHRLRQPRAPRLALHIGEESRSGDEPGRSHRPLRSWSGMFP